MNRPRLAAAAGFLFLLYLLNSAYIGAAASPSVFYMGNVLAHLAVGALLLPIGIWLFTRPLARGLRPALIVLLASGGLGAALALTGATRPYLWLLWTHIVLAILGVALLYLLACRKALAQGEGWSLFARGLGLATAAILFVPALSWTIQTFYPEPTHQIRNSIQVPTSMEEEGAGPDSPFWPSAAKTAGGGLIPSDYFLTSEKCGQCHKDIYEQWKSSMHHFASFNNQFYRKSIEHMQSIAGTKPSRWCAGCHDHAVLFAGKWDTPIEQQIDTPAAQAGLGCVSCHSIVEVNGTVGNGAFTLEYPRIHDLVVSGNKYIRILADYLTRVDPEPHRRAFLKPFMRKDIADFCSSCHKVHLDVPVNDYRWIRGFNSYDNWQASGVSGEGARSFYYPPAPKHCGACHMPLVDSNDPGNIGGKVHSHRFAAANTAVPLANQDDVQMKHTLDFLQSGFITVDIFAASPISATSDLEMRRRGGQEPEIASTFGIGEESQNTGPVVYREVSDVAAPLDQTNSRFAPGSTIRLEVVVRTRNIGHFFPDGTVDAFDVWLELEARDAGGKLVFLSGGLDNPGGPVDEGAHFYRSYMLDEAGNPINKRNAWQTRGVLYARLIPPGAADVVHYRLAIPPNAKGPLTVTAKLNYRKFSHYYTQFAYAGKPTGGTAARGHDSRTFDFSASNIPANVSGQIKDRIPDVPVVVLATAEAKLPLGERGPSTFEPVLRAQDYERWNDWGIGMLLQGDLKGAEYAFQRVTEAYPQYPDGWLNLARALIQEGETDRAKPFLEKAMALDSSLARIHFFQAMIQKADGDYDAALQSLRTAAAEYPRDRVVWNQIGRLLFLKRQYAESVDALQRVLTIDPEDVQAHYNLMLAWRGLGEIEKSRRSEALFRRFKADEASQTVTYTRRMLSPEDNNERQPIHEHDSMPLPRPTQPQHAAKALVSEARF